MFYVVQFVFIYSNCEKCFEIDYSGPHSSLRSSVHNFEKIHINILSYVQFICLGYSLTFLKLFIYVNYFYFFIHLRFMIM